MDPLPDGSADSPGEPFGVGREGDRRFGEPRGDHSDYPGRGILGLGSARAILARLIDDDPFEIGPRCVERLRTEALLLSLKQVHLRVVARVAYAAQRYRGTPPLTEWLDQRIVESVDEVLREEREAERGGLPAADAAEPLYRHIANALGTEHALARRACIAFNDLPLAVRHAFFAVVIERKSISRYVAEGNGPPSQVKAHLRSATDAIRAATSWRDFGPEGGFPNGI